MSLEGQRIPLEDIRTAYFPRGNFVRDAVVGLVGSSIVLGALEHAGIIQKTPVEKLLSSREYLLSPVLKTVIPYAPIVGTLNAGDSDAAGTRAVSAVSIIANDVDTIGGDWSDIIATATAGKTIDHLVSVQLQDPRIEEMRISQPNRQAFLSAMQNDMGHAIFGDRQCQESMRFLESVPDAFQKFLQLKDLKNIPAELFEVGKNVVQLANRLDEFFSESKEKLVYAIEQLFGVLNPQSLTLLGFLPLEYARFIEYLPPGDNQKTLRFPVEGNPFRSLSIGEIPSLFPLQKE